MNDVQKYIQQRKQIDPEFSDNFESGYLNFKLEFLLTQKILQFFPIIFIDLGTF